MKTSETCIAAIKQFERFRSHAYRDPKGIWTIGYGQAIGVQPGDTISEPAADKLLRARIADLEPAVERAVKEPLTQGQFDALIDFEYNLGRGAFGTSTLLKKLNEGDYAGAAAEFPRWCKAGDRVLPGLLKRRLEEQAWFD